MSDVLVPIGHHRSATIPTTTPNDVDFLGHEGIGRTHDGADVEVVFEVLDGNVKRMPLGVEVLDYRLEAPIAILVNNVPAVAIA